MSKVFQNTSDVSAKNQGRPPAYGFTDGQASPVDSRSFPCVDGLIVLNLGGQ